MHRRKANAFRRGPRRRRPEGRASGCATEVQKPRDFVFVSSTLVLVACERSGEVHALRYDAETGAFTPLATLGGLYRPVALTPALRKEARK